MKSAGAPSTDITGLYNALLKAGIVAATGTPVGAGATITSEDTAAAPSMSSENLSRWSSKNTHYLSQNWVHEGHVDVKGKGRADSPWSTNNKAALTVDAAQCDAELHPSLAPRLSHPISWPCLSCPGSHALSLAHCLSCQQRNRI